MHYYVRMDKPDYCGKGEACGCTRKYFRSLQALLGWMQDEYGKWATSWRVDCLGGAERDARNLFATLKMAIENIEKWQWVYMGVAETCPDYHDCDTYCFTITKRDGDPVEGYSFSEDGEAAMREFKPDVGQSIRDTLRSFDIVEKVNYIDKAFETIIEYYCDEKDVPADVLNLRTKKDLAPKDYVILADECQSLGEEQLAAVLYVAGCCTNGEKKEKGEALVRLAELYMNSDWPQSGDRERDVMMAVDLLSEALRLGCVAEAQNTLEGMREQIFEVDDEEELDVDYIINNYAADALCLAAFCLSIGIGWKKDVASATCLFEMALARGYVRASYYLKEIRSGRI